MYTVITKGNKVNRVHTAAYSGIDNIIIVNESGKGLLTNGNPITWPTDAKNGLQAIVDVKAGTLRFAYDGWPRAQTEFVVSEYVAPAESLKPESVQHILDLIEYWPCGNPAPVGFRPAPQLPSGFMWLPQPTHWLLGVVGSPKTYSRDDWEARRSPDKPFVSVEDSDPVNRPSHYTEGGIECIDAIKASMSTESFLGFLKGNVQKYMWRYEKKVAPVEDLKKAQWYLSKLIEEQERS